MEKLVLIVHVLTALGIIGLILLQQGKGAEAGASFGSGASQTVFGSQGSGNFLSHLTAILATVFFVTSFGLAFLASYDSGIDHESGLPAVPAAQESSVPEPSHEGEKPQQSLPSASGALPSVDEELKAGELPEAKEKEDEEKKDQN
ncbi:MAG: preprotein translocase subunit SecG [Gammaproteobacteria bacterium]|nr:preprotein translocase subunit SecG [Gammaproteobacteria bacterium]